MCSDHPKFTTGGSVSNHTFGRGLDIASIDGEIVSPGSALAREVASELSQFDPALRPDEIGSPFAINGPGYFTDAAHSNHIHVGFKTELTPDFKLPADVSATAAPAAPARRRTGGRRACGRGSRRRPRSRRSPSRRRRSGRRACSARCPSRARWPRRRGRGARPPAIPSCSCRRSPPRSSRPQPAAPAAVPVDPAAVDLTGAPGAYPGDDAPKEQIAAWMAAEAEKRGLPAQLPVMAALVESNLTNVNFGDADSLGYFQMRVSFWEGPVRRLRRRPREAGRLVPRHRRTRQGATRQPRPIDHRPQPVRRMDRRRRTPRRAIPRPLPTQARRSQRTARQRTQDTRRTRSRRHRTHSARRARRAGRADRSGGGCRSGRSGGRGWKLDRCRGAARRSDPARGSRGRDQHGPAG